MMYDLSYLLLFREDNSRSILLDFILNDELPLAEQLQLLLLHFRLEALVLDHDLLLQQARWWERLARLQLEIIASVNWGRNGEVPNDR